MPPNLIHQKKSCCFISYLHPLFQAPNFPNSCMRKGTAFSLADKIIWSKVAYCRKELDMLYVRDFRKKTFDEGYCVT